MSSPLRRNSDTSLNAAASGGRHRRRASALPPRSAFHAERFEAREQTLQGEPNAGSAFGAPVSLSMGVGSISCPDLTPG
jgi:hypothetical protein